MSLVSYILSAFSRTLKDLRNYIQGKKAFGSLWLRLFFHLPQSGVFSYKMHRGTFATRRSLTCNFFICSYRSQISINFSRTNFHRDKSEVSLPIIKFLYSHIPRKYARTLCGILNAMSAWNGAAHFSGEVSRWTYPSGKTIVASPETDGFRLYLGDQADEPRLWSYRVSCENLLSSACSSPRIYWTEIWNVSGFYMDASLFLSLRFFLILLSPINFQVLNFNFV